MKKLVVLGASGFIGRNVAEHFASRGGFAVRGTYLKNETSIPGVEMVRADLRDAAEVKNALDGAEIVIQAAATTSGAKDICTRPHYHVTDNAVMNSLALRQAFESGVSRFVFFSCTVMYPGNLGRAAKEEDFDANAAMTPAYFGVGWTKVYVERMCEFFSRISKCRFTAIRHSNIYGPHDKYDLERSHVFGATVTKVVTAPDNGKILVWGTGEEERDLLHVSDLVRIVEAAVERQTDAFALVNAGLGRSVSVRGLVEKVIAASGKKLSIEHDTSKPSIPTKLVLDCSRARKLFGWEPVVGLDEGIKRTLAWHRENILPGMKR